MRKLVIFGNNTFAKLLKWYIDHDDERDIVAFTVEKEYIGNESEFEGLPLVPFDQLTEIYSIDEIEILICVGYSEMNNVRKKIFNMCRNRGYQIAQYIHSSVILSNAKLGEGNIILENTLVQPFVNIGHGNLIWYDVSIAHDSIIGDYNTITGKASICGFVTLKNNCFVGNSSVIRDKVVVDDYTLIGASAYVDKDSTAYSVIVPQKSIVLQDKVSTDFF